MALSVALYTFLSNNTKFREFSKSLWNVVMTQLLSLVCCSIKLLFEVIQPVFGNSQRVTSLLSLFDKTLAIIIVCLFVIGWLYLCKIFIVIYGSLYHLRKKRFIKYTKPIAWVYEKFFHKSFYEVNYRQRDNLTLSSFSSLDVSKLQFLKSGGSILLLYDDTADYSSIIVSFIKEAILEGDTVDYITTYKSPFEFCNSVKEQEISTVTKKLSIIDCFSPHYSFDDKVTKFAKQNYEKKGFKFFDAESFAEIHTAANDSWYRFRKVCKEEENSYRIPHRTIYDSLSSLIHFSSDEQYLLFIRHVLSSEKSYGMISLIIEPLSLNNNLKNDLIRSSDVVIEYRNNTMKQKK